MHNLDFKIGFGRKRLADGEEPRTMRHHTWVAVAIGGSAIVGAGVGLYGANKQSQAVADTNKQNAELQTQQNNSAWQAYLMSRGLNPQGSAAGVIPTNPQPINARLPLWANVNVTTGPKTWTRTAGRPSTAGAGRILGLNTGGAPAAPMGYGMPVGAPAGGGGGGGGDWWRGGGGTTYLN